MALATAAPLSARINLDGRLDEIAWATADSIEELTQFEPKAQYTVRYSREAPRC